MITVQCYGYVLTGAIGTSRTLEYQGFWVDAEALSSLPAPTAAAPAADYLWYIYGQLACGIWFAETHPLLGRVTVVVHPINDPSISQTEEDGRFQCSSSSSTRNRGDFPTRDVEQ